MLHFTTIKFKVITVNITVINLLRDNFTQNSTSISTPSVTNTDINYSYML